KFDFDPLNDVLDDIETYGSRLTDSFFAHPNVKAAFEQARTSADLLGVPLQVRLLIDSNEADLHNLRWETLRDPKDSSLLATGDRILFSRYLRSPDLRPVRVRQRSNLVRALVVIANPRNLNKYAPEDGELQRVDVETELALAQTGLGTIPLTALAKQGQAML